MKIITQPQEVTSAVTVRTRHGLQLTLTEHSNKGVIVTVQDAWRGETHRFQVQPEGSYIILRDLNSGRTLTMEEVTK